MHKNLDAGKLASGYSQRELLREAINRYLARDPEFSNLDFARQQQFSRRQLRYLQLSLGVRQA